ncbi:MAG: ABC transporter permease [Anaerolineae bacterium]|jgi:ABC-2 type transport system permease protein|nr:ABC transporter permease [Anaerolineae bacterium]MDX9830723.1 ABC transporter permease [Anaerolineae bacterium]
MVGFRKLTLVQAKLYLREPMSAFFTLLFGPSLLLLLGFIFGNEPSPATGGLGYLDQSVPAYMAIIIGIVGLTAVPITSATRREMGVLRRFSATPLRPLAYFLTDVLVPFLITLLGILLLVLVGAVVFRVRFEGNLLSLFAGIALGACAFFALGYALVGLVPSARAVTLIGNVVLYPLMIFSGSVVPLEVMPDAVQSISRFLPLTHLVTFLRGLWSGNGWGEHLVEVAVLAGIAILGTLIIARTFRWE